MFDFDMRDLCQDLENLSVSRYLRSQTEHRENCAAGKCGEEDTKTDHV